MRKIKRILILAIVAIIGVASFGCKPSNESAYPVYGDFVYRIVTLQDGDKFINILGLSEEGKCKKIIVVPSRIDGYSVRIGESGIWSYGGYWESDNLETVYIDYGVPFYSDIFDRCSKLEKIIHIVWNEYEYVANSKYYVPKYDNGNVLMMANVSFYYNYHGARNKGFYWIDDLDNEKIDIIPADPIREGYRFDGWYKEEQCENKWNFEKDIVQAKEYDENGNYLYKETPLFAKWLKE